MNTPRALVIASALAAAGCMAGGFVPVAPQPTGFEAGNPCNVATPLEHPQAEYPARAGEQPGWVALQYDIAADGATANVVIKASSPEGVFDRSAVAAVSQWKYRADQPIAGCRLLITFRPPD